MSDLQPSRELDALVAEKVMGLKPPKQAEYFRKRQEWVWSEEDPGIDHSITEFFWPPHYSTNIAAAWEVVEKMRDLGMELELSVVPKGAPAYPDDAQWLAGFHDDGPTNQKWGATAPHSICLAALKAAAS